MTYQDYLENKDIFKKRMKGLGLMSLSYFIVIVLLETPWMVLLMCLVWLIPGLVGYYTLTENKEKRKLDDQMRQDNPEDEIILIKRQKSKGVRQVRTELSLAPVFIVYILMIMDWTDSLLIKAGHLVFMALVISLAISFTSKYYKHELMLLKDRFIINNKVFTYQEVKRYQAIPLRNDLVLLEVQAKDLFSSLVVTKEDYKIYESYCEGKVE